MKTIQKIMKKSIPILILLAFFTTDSYSANDTRFFRSASQVPHFVLTDGEGVSTEFENEIRHNKGFRFNFSEGNIIGLDEIEGINTHAWIHAPLFGNAAGQSATITSIDINTPNGFSTVGRTHRYLLSTAAIMHGVENVNSTVYRVEVGRDNTDDQGVMALATRGLMTLNRNYIFDGTNWDRMRSTVAADNTNLPRGVHVVNAPLEFDGTLFDIVRHSFNQSTTLITTNAAGTTLDLTGTPSAQYTMIVDRTVGATNTVEVDIECAIGTTFVQIATVIDLTNEPVLVSHAGTPCNNIRYNVVTIGAGNTLTIELLSTR